MSELLLGVDVGSSATKAVAVTPRGEVVAGSEVPHSISFPRPDWAEHDAETDWWDGFVGAVRAIGRANLRRVRAVCVSGVGPCVLPCDRNGVPVRPAILYGIDSRAREEIELLTRRFGAASVLARTGSALTSQAVGPKLLWLARHEPGNWARTARWYMPGTFIVARLCGEYVLDHHSASQCTPMYDLRAQDWAEDWASEISGPVPLPSLVWPGEVVGVVGVGAAERSGLCPGTVVVAGSIDAWVEALGVGVRRPGDLMLMYGTTSFQLQVADQPVPTAGVWLTNGIESGTLTYAAGTAAAGALTDWTRRLLGVDGFTELSRLAAGVSAGSRGVIVLPYFAGERSPLFDPDRRGVVSGLTLSHGREELARACYEATAYAMRHNLAVMSEVAGPPRRVVVAGGGTKSSVWTQIVSSVTGLVQQVPAHAVGASYGDALLAGRGLGLVSDDEDWSVIIDTVEPVVDDVPVYDEMFEIYRDLGRANQASSERLARWQRSAVSPHDC